MSWTAVTKTKLPYVDEKNYSKTRKQVTERLVEVDAHVFLHYCRLRGEVAQAIRSEIQQHPALAVIGFLTGSVGLLASARPYIERANGARLAYSRGLSHTAPGLKKAVTECEFFRVLNEVVHAGIQNIVLVDEIVSGGQMRSGLKSLATWQKSQPSTALGVSVIGCHDNGITSGGQKLIVDLRDASKWSGITLCGASIFHATRLLEKDNAGLAFRSTKKGDVPGTYDFERELPAGFASVCPCSGGFSMIVSASSLDQSFGNHVAAVLGQSRGCLYKHITQQVQNSGCETCRLLLAAARELGLSRCW